MEEINKLIQRTIDTYPELEYDIEAIKMAYLEDLEWGQEENYVTSKMKIEISNLVKLQQV